MCSAVKCKICGKTTWAGCGQHVAMVKRSVPAAQWCGGKHTQAEINEARANRGSVFSRLFGN